MLVIVINLDNKKMNAAAVRSRVALVKINLKYGNLNAYSIF